MHLLDHVILVIFATLLMLPQRAYTRVSPRAAILSMILTTLAGAASGLVIADFWLRLVAHAMPLVTYVIGAGAGATLGLIASVLRVRVGSMAEQSKRRWFQYSTRTLLVLTAVCALAFSLWKQYIGPYTAERQAILLVKNDIGGTITTRVVGPVWLRSLIGDTRVAEKVAGWLTDDDLKHLRQLRHLRELDLSYAPVTNKGLEELRGMRHLRRLTLMGTAASNEGLEHLKSLPNLEVLDLRGTQITDAGLKQLKDLRNLKDAYLAGDQVTAPAVAELRRERPQLRIWHAGAGQGGFGAGQLSNGAF